MLDFSTNHCVLSVSRSKFQWRPLEWFSVETRKSRQTEEECIKLTNCISAKQDGSRRPCLSLFQSLYRVMAVVTCKRAAALAITTTTKWGKGGEMVFKYLSHQVPPLRDYFQCLFSFVTIYIHHTNLSVTEKSLFFFSISILAIKMMTLFQCFSQFYDSQQNDLNVVFSVNPAGAVGKHMRKIARR